MSRVLQKLHHHRVVPASSTSLHTTSLAGAKDKLDLSFNDHEAAYRSKKTSEVARAYFVLSLCGVKPLVKHNAKLMKIGQKIGIMVASHNADTVRYGVRRMEELGLDPQERVLCFAQLLGMCDQITFPLGQGGYSVYKYVPYGPVNEVLPYLSRRANENGSMLAKVALEKKLLRTELVRRIMKGQFFYNPQGSYKPVGH